jgi:hypothetical protein
LIRVGLRIVADELRHAELSQRVYRRAGGNDPPLLTQESLQLMRSRPELAADVTAVALQTFCLGETAAVRLFHRLRAQCSVPVARQALDRVLRDEVRHREFGWQLLSWLLTLPDAAARRAAIANALPRLLAELRTSYGGDASRAAHTSAERCSRAQRAWGLMPPAEYRQAIASCIERDLRPRFARLEISGCSER